MENKDLQRHLFSLVKAVADSTEFELKSFTVDGDLVDVSWKVSDAQGNAVELAHAFYLSLMRMSRIPEVEIEEEVFICKKIIEEAMSDDH